MKQVENIQLLYSLLEVFKAQSLSEASRKLGKTTSSVSKDLSKLREQLDDPLFMRSNNRMLPTEYVSNIMPDIERLLNDIGHTLTSKNTIIKENYNKRIKIAIAHIIMELYGDELSVQLSSLFPNAKIELVTWDSASNHQLQNEQIDFGIHFNLVDHPGNVRYRRIIAYDLAIVCPEEDKDKQIELILSDRNFMFLSIKDWNDVEKVLTSIAAKNDIDIRYTHFVDNLSTAIKIVKREELGFIVPKIIAEYHQLHYVSWSLATKGLIVGLYYNAHQNEMLTNIMYDTISNIFKPKPTN
ncbi:LysR family transcriptional regulator [Vibrio cionasavignyae]|uniref:LysR family transcriptional regulator n=1 Tax=Vibrio cionasavignyae TaxID=2910252 RepID=UPI003D14D3BA